MIHWRLSTSLKTTKKILLLLLLLLLFIIIIIINLLFTGVKIVSANKLIEANLWSNVFWCAEVYIF